jgi:hypothetical protein
LITEKLLQQVHDSAEPLGMEWVKSSEQYNSIGKVEFQFAELNAIRQKNTEVSHGNYYRKDDTEYNEIRIGANFRDVYMVMMNIPGRSEWQPALQKVEQATPGVYVGSVHKCTFDNYNCLVSPLNMTLSEEGILYAESFRVPDMDISLIHEFLFRKVDDHTCDFLYRSMDEGDKVIPAPDKLKTDLSARMERLASTLKSYCENMEGSFFDPAFKKI